MIMVSKLIIVLWRQFAWEQRAKVIEKKRKEKLQTMKSDVSFSEELLDYRRQAVTVIRFCHKVLNSKMPHASSYDSLSEKNLLGKKVFNMVIPK